MIEQYEGEAMTVGALFHRDFQKSLLVDMADALESMSCHYIGHVVSTQRSAQVDRWGTEHGNDPGGVLPRTLEGTSVQTR